MATTLTARAHFPFPLSLLYFVGANLITSPALLLRRSLLALFLFLPLLAAAQEDVIRKNLAERIPMLQSIDEVRATPMEGLYEVRVGNDVLYTDASGNFLLQGVLFDTRAQKNLTQERRDELNAIAFDALDLDNAFKVVYGKGTRKMAAFEDPNCPYCKRFEQDLSLVNDVTVYTFLLPILGPDSVEKSNQIWCSDDRTQAWLDWMIDDVKPKGSGKCNTDALKQNLAFAREHGITGTPTLIFEDCHRIPGAIDTAQIEALLSR